ncbi:MAG: acyltransferase [Deltaproteobacteria bacterium]|nr:acyltransferase [Deltaproteobacteria bacterium]
MSLAYRREIDGLRALAILPVVAYHAGWPPAPGGFVGVDVFFVISGFLITGILLREFEGQSFSFRHFYARRARRILPALFSVLLATIAAGMLWLEPYELRLLGQSTLAALGFVANFFFLAQTGYFGPEADQLPLLHTWSLAVEEQFYLLYPLLLWLAFRSLKKRVDAALLLALAAFFALSAWGAGARPDAAFYLTPFRMWELLLGGALASVAIPRVPRIAASAAFLGGIAMIVASISRLDPHAPASGALSWVPALGAALIIGSGDQVAPRLAVLMTHPLMVWIGRISYSMYLWHWPMLVLARRELAPGGRELSLPILAGYFVALVGVSSASYALIEQPFRRRATRARWAAGGVIALGIAALALLIVRTDGLPDRLTPFERGLAAYAKYSLTQGEESGVCFASGDKPWSAFDAERCIGGEMDARTIFIWGDSVAAYLMRPVRAMAERAGLRIREANMSGCRPALGPTGNQNCDDFSRHVLERIESGRPRLVILCARWNIEDAGGAGEKAPMIERLDTVAKKLRGLGARVLIVGPPVQYERPLPSVMMEHPAADFSRFELGSARRKDADAFDAAASQRFDGARVEGIEYFSIAKTQCEGTTCRVAVDGVPVQFDGHHYTYEGAQHVAERLFPRIVRSLAQASGEAR